MPIKDKKSYNSYMKVYMAKRYEARLLAAVDQLGGRCAVCGEEDRSKLDFDHIDSSTKLFVIGRSIAGVSEERLQVELGKCQLLCRRCHRHKTVMSGELPKGSEKPNARLNEDDVRAIRKRYRRWCRKNGSSAIAREYGVSNTTILMIVKRESWKHVD